MSKNSVGSRLRRLHDRFNGSTIEYDLEPYHQIVEEINKKEMSLKKNSDQQLKRRSHEFIQHAGMGDNIDNLLTDAYALVKVAIQRILKLNPFDVQLVGAIVLHRGKLAEMATGEGKTLSAVFPAYLNAISGRGVHILTFNDYLAHRDAQWMGPVYEFLGLSVGYIREGMSISERQRAYNSNITYVTAKEAGFDFLRDSMCFEKTERVHRAFHFALVDEADSILIDEARVPLVIAGTTEDRISESDRMAKVAKKMDYRIDIAFDEADRNVYLTDSGLARVEKILQCGNLYAEENIELLTRLNCALHAEFLLHMDVDYIVREDKIELVDEFTGRVADMRRWPDGLQAAIEAKERISIKNQGTILNSITLQHYLRLYPKLCGMTATAQTAEEEFCTFYDLDIVVIPQNIPCVRVDHDDMLFKTRNEKHAALIEEINKVNSMKRPILVGTRSVEESETLSQKLLSHGIECKVLNAKNDEYEAQIIAQAGRLSAVTISTNMAGRGTDIRLGGFDEKEKEEVIKLGGLYMIGTNRHESVRIDNQLRGRAGRQGDPGSSRFFISLEDDLFLKYCLKDLIPPRVLALHSGGEVKNKAIKREIERLQRIIQGQNLEIKKTLTRYSGMIEEQRKVINNMREDVLNGAAVSGLFAVRSKNRYNEYKHNIDRKHLDNLCQKILLYCIDKSWSQYLADIAEIRESIHLQTLGGNEPFIEFQKIAVNMFEELIREIEDEAIRMFETIKVCGSEEDFADSRLRTPSATWTYQISDDPFELQRIPKVVGLTGAGSFFLMISFLLRKIMKK